MSGATVPAEATGASAPDWAGFARLLVGAAAVLFGALVLALVVIDPYDTGRPGLLRVRGTFDQYPFTANASRARDPRFDAAIFGNSHVQMLNPGRLDGLTGLKVVTLMMPATWPSDQLRVLAWRREANPTPVRALVFGIDDFWCQGVEARSPNFPDWLYSLSAPAYVVGLVRYRSLEAAASRLRVLLTGKGAARPDGYWDYAPEYARRGLSNRDVSRRRLAQPAPPALNESGRYPGFAELRAVLAGLDPATAVLLLRPPVYRTGLPAPGSPEEADQARCGREIAALAASRPRTAVLDLFRPGPMADDMDDWYDHSHYREGLAQEVERRIADALRPILGAARAD